MSEILLIDWLTGIGQTSLTFLVSAGLAERPSYEGSARVLNSRHWQQTVAVSEGISFKLNDVFTSPRNEGLQRFHNFSEGPY